MSATGGPRYGRFRPAAQSLRAAALFLLAACCLHPLLSAQEQPLPSQPAGNAPGARVTIHGFVRNALSSEPLARALVRIEGDTGQGALTDNEGRFEISNVLAGPEVIQVIKPGFHDRTYATEEISYEADGPAHSVLVTADMQDLEFPLTPDSAIHGRVELSNGDPGQGININLFKRVVRYGREVWVQNANTRTNADGGYRFGRLTSGIYAVGAMPTLESEPAVTAVATGAQVKRNGYPAVYYPDAREFSGATRIKLQPGEQADANLSLTLEPFQTVTATVILPGGKALGDDGGQSGFVAPAVMDTSGHKLPYTAQYDAATHTVQANLPDGNYELYVMAAPPAQAQAVISHAFIITSLSAGFADIAVAGHPVANVRIPLSPLAKWPIRLRALRTAPVPAAHAGKGLQEMVTVAALPAGDTPGEGWNGEAIAEAAGPDLLELSTLGPGTNWIHTQVNDRSLCMGSFSAAGINLAREPLVVGPSASAPPMDLTLRDDCATLQLTLPPALADFAPGEEPFYTVYVVPDFDTTDDLPPMTMHPSSGPTLNLDGLTPGSYHVYVFTTPVRLEYRNPNAMAALSNPGQQVTLSPGATSNLVLEVPEH